MKYLVTGGCGFVGSNMANAFLSEGAEVCVLDNLSRLGSEENLAWLRQNHGHDWRFIHADIRDRNTVEALVQELKPDAILHFAGQVAMTTSLANPHLDFEINAGGSVNVLESVRTRSPETIVMYSSTNKVYGDLSSIHYEEQHTRYFVPAYPLGFDETLPLDFQSPYGCSKGCADQYMLDYARMFGLRTVVFRHSSMYGGRQFATSDQGWVGWFCCKILEQANFKAGPFTISGDGKQVRDLLFSDDLVSAYKAALRDIDRATGQAFNIGGGMNNSISLLELFNELASLTGHVAGFEHLPWRKSDQKVFIANNQKASDHFGWTPAVSKVEGIHRMLEWSKQIS